MCLLSTVNVNENPEGSDLASNDVKNAVIFSSQVLEQHQRLLPQYGLLGEVLSSDGQSVTDPRLFLNTNHPFSAFLCGLQGAGKSHSLSCLLENCLLSTRTLGVLKRPLSAMVFHFSQYTSRLNFRPCEAAFIACPDPKFKVQCTAVPVTVLVSPSNLLGLRLAYSQIPGVTVKPFLLRPQDLNIGSMLTLMSVSKSSEQPLYISHVTKLLREMAAESSEFDFLGFKQRLAQVQMLPLQRKPLEQRLDLLESFLDLDGTSNVFDFTEGSITIVDLSCPFVDENTACVLFNIALSTFLQDSTPGAGKVVAVDEAHKYITDTPASKVFTESLLQLIRQQRHYGARIIISTQEPTIDPRLMDLCSVTLIHRFTSPEWFKTLQKHVSTMEERDVELFKRIINLRVGEGLIFAPGAVVAASVLENNQDTMLEDYPWGEGHPYQHAGADKVQPIEVEKLGSRFLKVKVRRRLTADVSRSAILSFYLLLIRSFRAVNHLSVYECLCF
ncbi:hypothetical protein FN846DRAFT_784756 [Sphaerosporella brunnea]|uniref:P-loop containing nucleoside triphosphate hydrolase protein n=1 Tax=Sphaerosporella brunnea TaxID=1250544 RepID=A0A5J5EKS0_9PEZI|nr:hypothetical protein FN846DRAFT_784756 [Sphaerosporella brunnea]